MTTAADPWTTRRLLAWMEPFLRERDVEAPRVVAEMLLGHVLGCERMRLYMEIDRPASPAERERLRDLVARAGRHEPVHYLVGERWFFGRAFEVDRSTLIPQPSTETLLEAVLEAVRPAPGDEGDAAPPAPVIADVGTGTGCIAISLAAALPAARIVATDVVPGALDLARRNAERHGLSDRIEFRAGSLLEPLRGWSSEHGRRFDVIASNPPYIPHDERDRMDACVRDHVPASAWDGGADGLDCLRPLIAGAADLLEPGGRLVLEMASRHLDAVRALVEQAPGLGGFAARKDLDGLWRVVEATA